MLNLSRSRYPRSKLRSLDDGCTQLEFEFARFLDWYAGTLVRRRLYNGLSQVEFARYLNTTAARISHLENGAVDFKMSTFFRISRLFGSELTDWVADRETLESGVY